MTTIELILKEANLNNHALVEASLGQLSHKTVQKARTGNRPISKKMQVQVTEALNKALQPEKLYKKEDLFPTRLNDDL